MDDQTPSNRCEALTASQSDIEAIGGDMSATNAAIVAKKPILVKQTAVTGEPKKNMSLAEARSKLFSSVMSSTFNKSHDHVKTVPINLSTANKGQSMPLTSPSYVIEKNETIRLQIVNRKPALQLQQQTTTSVATAPGTVPIPSTQTNQKDYSLPLLLPFPPGQITIKSNRSSEQPLTPIANTKSTEASAHRMAIVKAKMSIAPNDVVPKRSRPVTQAAEGCVIGSDDVKPKIVPKKFVPEPPATLGGAPIPSNWKQLEQHFNKVQSTLGVGHMPKELSAALQEFKQWQLENDPDNTMPKQLLNNKLNEFIGKNVRTKRRINNQPNVQQRSTTSTDSEADTDSVQPKKRKTSLSCDSMTSIKTLPETNTGIENIKVEDVPAAKRKDSDHDSLYHLLRSEATEHLMKRKAALGGTQSSSSSSSSLSSTAASVQILNGKLSDPKGPIRLLDKSVLTPLPQPQQMLLAHVIPSASTATVKTDPSFLDAAITAKSKAKQMQNSTNFQENLHKIFALQHKLPPNSKLSSRALERLKNSPRRTASGRSKSFSSSGPVGLANAKMRFKIGGMTAKARRMRMSSKNMNRQWSRLGESGSRVDGDSKAADSERQPSPSEDTTTIAEARSNFKDVIRRSIKELDCVNDLMRSISWNDQNGQGNVMHMGVKFKRNEFGMIEVSEEHVGEVTRSDEPKNYGKQMKRLKTEVKDTAGCMLSDNGMTCGHKTFDECFDAVIARIPNGAIDSSVINQRKPHEYFSDEMKEFIMSMVRKSDHTCNLIKAKEIIEAIGNAPGGSFNFDIDENSLTTFDWSEFMANFAPADDTKRLQLAPDVLFDNPTPSGGNPFSIGEKLEAIDPQNCALFCICTVVGLCGYRIKLHFDGYHSSYDFWTNADSVDLFHVGWCNRTGRELQWPHRRIGNSRETSIFDWNEYLRTSKAKEAPRACFTHLNSVVTNKNPFKIGMKLEADDIKFTRKICVATIGDVIDSRILITFDGFDDASNYWTDITSPYIHPVNWHNENGYSITSPPGWKGETFDWETYLRINRAEGVPDYSFCTRNPIAFSVGMTLEIVDKKNPSLIRPASIVMVDEYEIKVLFIGWPETYAYWVDDDSPDIHPPNWARKTGHPIENVPDDTKTWNGCGIRGCRGIGNAKKPELNKHTTDSECPYELKNWLSDDRAERPNRIERKNRTTNSGFNTGASACRTRLPAAAVADMHTHVSLKPLLNPAELAGMLPKDVEMFRRLQVSSKFLLDNAKMLGRLHENWESKLQDKTMVRLCAAKKNPLNWSVDEVSEFVSQLPNCSMLGPVFVEHGIDGMAFLALRKSDMLNIMGLSTGSTIKVFNRIIYLREECNAHYINYD